MRTVRLSCMLLIAVAASAGEVTHAGRWELHSSFWMNLQQSLAHDAAGEPGRDLSVLSPEERASWDAAVAAFHDVGSGDISFARPMMITQDELTQVADDAMNPAMSGPLSDALRKAAPVYRKHWWVGDDAGNRFFIGYATAMLRDSGEELAREHEKVYGAKLPESIRVDITSWAGPFGAYSLFLKDGGYVTTMSSRDPGYAGLAVVEMIQHEASHAIVSPRNGSVARAIAEAAKKLGIDPPNGLWHAILFGTSGELARRALERRGAVGYVPSTHDLFSRVWPNYREAIEKYWYPYLSGTGTLEEAIAKIVAATR